MPDTPTSTARFAEAVRRNAMMRATTGFSGSASGKSGKGFGFADLCLGQSPTSFGALTAAFCAGFQGFISGEFLALGGAVIADSGACLGNRGSQRTVTSPDARSAHLQTADAKLKALGVVFVAVGQMRRAVMDVF